jgi:hypothetical protein
VAEGLILGQLSIYPLREKCELRYIPDNFTCLLQAVQHQESGNNGGNMVAYWWQTPTYCHKLYLMKPFLDEIKAY